MCVCMPLTKHMPLLCGTCACPTTEAQPHPPKLKLIPARGGSVRLRCGPFDPSFLPSLSPSLLGAAAAAAAAAQGGGGEGGEERG